MFKQLSVVHFDLYCVKFQTEIHLIAQCVTSGVSKIQANKIWNRKSRFVNRIN